MKYLNKNVLLSALLLTGTVAFTSCSKDDDFGGEETTLTGEAVKTQFAISVPYGSSNSAETRMSSTTVQSTGNFRGMKNIYLIPLTAEGSSSSTFTQIIPLADFNRFDNNSSNHKVYSDVEIPVGTSNFLFYGEGGTTSETTATTYGQLNSTLVSSTSSITGTSGITFTLQDIASDYVTTGDEAKAILQLLNDVADVDNWNGNATLGSYYTEFTRGSITYTSTGATEPTTITTQRCGSANAVKNMMESLYNTMTPYLTNSDATVQQIASDIQALIGASFTITPTSPSTSGNELSWSYTFPTSLGLPEGAVVLSNTSGDFSYATSSALLNIIDPTNVTYPSSLYYFVNTPLRATTSTATITWPSTAETWLSDAWTGWSQSSVAATTRAIALKNNIQYSVAQLVTTVKCATANLEDNAKNIAGTDDNNKIVVPSAGFPVTGILIGGQPNTVEWDFYSPSTSNAFAKTIYDNCETNNTTMCAQYNATTSTTNYTLVLDNLNGTLTTQSDVNVAIELTNNSGTAFYGYDGLIAKGAKFYLIGTLKISDIPEDSDLTHIFTQDYKTTANFTITNLQNAYATIPDLRASQMQLGLSVDLSWQEGVTFNIEL